jgi:hypothetical protein
MGLWANPENNGGKYPISTVAFARKISSTLSIGIMSLDRPEGSHDLSFSLGYLIVDLLLSHIIQTELTAMSVSASG